MDLLVRPAARPRTSDKAPSAQHWRCARETVLFPPENKQEGRKALARRRPNNRGRARGGLSGVCHVQLRVVASGRNSPVALLSLLPGSSSVPPSPSVQSGTQIYERRAAVKQSGKREWQAGRGSRHDGRRRQRHYRRNRRGSTGSRSNRARRGNCWDKTLLG